MEKQKQINQIKKIAEEFFSKMTMVVSVVSVDVNSAERNLVVLNIKLDEPQVLIGQGGQTLSEIQRLLRIILSKKFEDIYYLNLDINDYKSKKVEYLKDIAKSVADEVSLSKQEKSLPPMPSYERRIIHAELSKRADVSTESRGEGPDRHIVIKPK